MSNSRISTDLQALHIQKYFIAHGKICLPTHCKSPISVTTLFFQKFFPSAYVSSINKQTKQTDKGYVQFWSGSSINSRNLETQSCIDAWWSGNPKIWARVNIIHYNSAQKYSRPQKKHFTCNMELRWPVRKRNCITCDDAVNVFDESHDRRATWHDF